MTPEQLEHFKEKLLALKDRLLHDIDQLHEVALGNSQRESSGDLSGYSLHMADQGTDNFDREFTFDLVSNEQEILYQIDEALERIENGTFGICSLCPNEISIQRLDALPFTQLCIDCKTVEEKNRRKK